MSLDIPLIRTTGLPFEVGRVHAEATLAYRNILAENVSEVLEIYGRKTIFSHIEPLSRVLREWSPDTLHQLAGMAEVFEFTAEEMLAATLRTYFDGLRRSNQGPDEGCSTYAYSHGGKSVLVKNRDTDARMRKAQTILQVAGPTGYAWTALSTAGAPGVHSAGMNEHGLSVADTHVPSKDVGPGLPRFAMMMNLLQNCKTVAEAERYLTAAPSMGYGNIIMMDSDGFHAVAECGYNNTSVLFGHSTYSVATNHFESDAMRDMGLQSMESTEGRDSRARKRKVTDELADLGDNVLEAPRAPMKHHEEAQLGSVCVHASRGSATISTIVMKPRERLLAVSVGNPCSSNLNWIQVTPQDWSSFQ